MEYSTGFFTIDNTFYEDGSPEQDVFLSQPITEDEKGSLLGLYKQLWQDKKYENEDNI